MDKRLKFGIPEELEYFLKESYNLNNWISISCIGSRFYGYNDEKSDFDFLVLSSNNKEFIECDDTSFQGIPVQIFKYNYHEWIKFLPYFSAGNEIKGDWGELGMEAFLHFLQNSELIIGDNEKCDTFRSLLTYPDSFSKLIIKRQSSRLINSLRQKGHSFGRSKTLEIKCRYDFLDSFLRLTYASNHQFFSTIKWFEKDLVKYKMKNEIVSSLKKIIDGEEIGWEKVGIRVLKYLHKKDEIILDEDMIEILKKEKLW